MDRFSKIGVLIFILWMWLTPHEYCSSQSPSDPAVNSMCVSAGGNPEDFFTLGQRSMMAIRDNTGDILTRPGDSVDSGNKHSPHDTIFVDMYAMTIHNSNPKRYLSGWLYIRLRTYIDLNPQGKWFNREMYAQMEDENGNAVGEFENNYYWYCEEDGGYDIWDTFEMYPPCGQVAPSATKVSNTLSFTLWKIVVNSKQRDVLKDFYQSKLDHRGPSMFFKFSHTSCNKPEKIRLRVYVRSTDEHHSDNTWHYGTLRTNWMKINWTGAADILRVGVGEKATCFGKRVYVSNGPVQDVTEIPWIEKVEPTIPFKEEYTNQDIVRTKKFCKAVQFKVGMDVSAVPSFAGRCLKHDEYSVSRNNKHECTAGATADPSFMKYSEYLKKRRSCMKISRCPCQCKATLEVYQLGTRDPFCPNFTETPTPLPDGTPPPKPLTIGYTTEGKAGKPIMEHRKLHGIVMLVVTLSFVPISITLSRYFKETWIQRAHLQVLHVWYLVHVALTFMTLCMYMVGSIAIMRSITVMGRSFVTSSMHHKLLGTGTILLFAGTVLIGSFRHVQNSAFRKIMMITHALLGLLYYFLGILTAITSSWIPGSPSSDNTECIDSPKFMENSTWTFMPYLVGWVGVDIIFHIVFTVLQCVADKKSEYKRPMYFPLVPILKGGETHDTHGKPIRVLLFLIYCGINLGITFMLVVKIISTSKAGCGFGPTTCTHSDLHTPLGMDICGI
ncbi:unnamed protein product [Orchesella dallaii]|uniref:ascorbate ferrireductase (transmembrane) n=1 Tax=Orchesella dallaii TaxID=48710 RepID=A0ABP1QRA6_9HEXA